MRRAAFLALLFAPAAALAADLDRDGVDDATDNCPGLANPAQADVDADGWGDACVDPSATVAATARLDRGATVGPRATVEADAWIGVDVRVPADAFVGAGASLAPKVVLGDRAHVGAGSALGRRAAVGADAWIGEDVVVGRGVVIGARATIDDGATLGYAAQVGEDAIVGAGAALANLAFVGAGATVGDGSRLGRGARVLAGATVGARPGGVGVVVGPDATVDAGATVGDGAVLRRGATVGPSAVVEALATIGRGAIVGRGARVGTLAVLRAEARAEDYAIVDDQVIVPRGAVVEAGAVDAGALPDPASFPRVWIVAPWGNDALADGTDALPFASVPAAIAAAAAGDGVHVYPGVYRWRPVDRDSTTGAAIWDQGKSLHVWGHADRTIVQVVAADNTTARDVHAMTLTGAATVVSNLTVHYTPNRGASYGNALFGWCSATAQVRNVWFEHTGTQSWSYVYDNNYVGGPAVFHSVFASRGRSTSDYSGAPEYFGALFDAQPSLGTRTGSLTRAVSWADRYRATAPADLRDAGGEVVIGTGAGTWYWDSTCPPDGTADADDDGHPDACDRCPADPVDDRDNDGVCDSADACDGFRDAADADADGLPDACDLCPSTPGQDCALFPPVSDFGVVRYVSTHGSDTTGTGTVANPFRTLSRAVTASVSGDGIALRPGAYRLAPIAIGDVAVGVYDQGKALHIWGANDKTVLEVHGADSSTRDASVFALPGGSTVSNLTVHYWPNRGASYSNAIAHGTFVAMSASAEIHNVFVENRSPTVSWTYVYDNGYSGGPRWSHSVFRSHGRSQGDYSGNPVYTDCLFDVAPTVGTRTGNVTRPVQDADLFLQSLPADLRAAGGHTDHVGTGGGALAWTTDCPPDGRPDTDEDLHPDACDPCPFDPIGDTDGNGVCDQVDACVGQPDADADGYCDAIDHCLGDDATGDGDGDGVCDGSDACFGDDASGDPDADGRCTDRDICPTDPDDACGVFPDPASFLNIRHVAPHGNDTTGDGSETNPYLTLDKAVSVAVNGDGIRLLRGRHRWTPVSTGSGFTSAAVWDRGKRLHIWGANADTVLEVDCALTAERDCHVATLHNAGSVLSNVWVDYWPTHGASYSNAIFGWHVAGTTVHNVVVVNRGAQAWSYIYDNSSTGAPTVRSSAFLANGLSTSNYSGTITWRSVLFDATPSNGTFVNSPTRPITTADLWVSTLPADLRNAGDPSVLNPDGTRSHIGPGGGSTAWNTPCPPDGRPDTDGDGQPDACDLL